MWFGKRRRIVQRCVTEAARLLRSSRAAGTLSLPAYTIHRTMKRHPKSAQTGSREGSFSRRPVAGLDERCPRLEQALEARQDQRPAVRDGADELRLGTVHFVDDRQLHRITDRLELISQARISLLAQFGTELVAPLEHEPPRRNAFNDLAAVGDATIRNHDPPRRAGLPVGLLNRVAPILARELGVGQGLPELFRSRADVSDIDELAGGHGVNPSKEVAAQALVTGGPLPAAI